MKINISNLKDPFTFKKNYKIINKIKSGYTLKTHFNSF